MGKYGIIFALIGQAYGSILRPLLKKAIDDPAEEWDDLVLEICDRLFGFNA